MASKPPASTRRIVGLAVAAWVGVNGALLLALPVLGFFRYVGFTYGFNTLVLPGLLLVSAGVAVRMGRKPLAAGCGALAVGLVLLRGYATHYEPHRLVVHHETMTAPELEAPLRILHLSDIQSDAIGDWEAEVFDRIAQLDFDLVLHTGDLLQPIPPATIETEAPKLKVLVDRVRPKLGAFHVDGDTDWWIVERNPKAIMGFERLASSSVVVESSAGRVAILGLTLPESRVPARGKARIREWLDRVGDAELKIVLGHAPDYILGARSLPIDLALAGHTHGGQIRLPGIGPLVTLSHVPRDWARGFRTVDGVQLNVSAGIGSEHMSSLPDIRFLCPPEMTLIEVEHR